MKKKLSKIFFLIISLTIIILLTQAISAANITDNNTDSINTNFRSDNTNNYIEETAIQIETDNNDDNTIKNKTDTTTTINKTIVKKETDTNTKTSGVMDIPLNKSRKIYFAMDHTSKKDQTICNNIITRLKNAGFTVARYRIGPNAMYQNMVYIYNNKITNAIIFHLFNGVDPSNIRELATNGNDNRGRIVRKRGNDVVLAWFYDSGDCIHTDGTCYKSVRSSETGSRLYNPKTYMDNNDIRYICTSSNNGRHKSTADYTGIKTVTEFMKLFNHDTITKITDINNKQERIYLNGSVTSDYANNINGNITIKDSLDKIIKKDIKVVNGLFSTNFIATSSGMNSYSVNFIANNQHKASNTTFQINIPKNVTITLTQTGTNLGYATLDVLVLDKITKTCEKNRVVYYKSTDGKVKSVKTDKNGYATINITSNKERFEVYCMENKKIINSVKKTVYVEKNNSTITIKPVIGKIKDTVTLTAVLKDQNNNYISGGNLVFKINGITLRSDNSLNYSLPALKINVVNGIAKIELTNATFLKNAKITATYSGSYKFNGGTSNTVVSKVS